MTNTQLPPNFATTRWSVVLAAGATERSRSALSMLCESYWYPLYAFVRRRGNSAQDAEDLTQGFFAKLLERDDLRDVSPEKGKFRAFLLACLKNFLANEHDKASALKRGGGRTIESLDSSDAERRYQMEPAEQQTPETLFDRSWALTLIEQAVTNLREEYQRENKSDLFQEFKGHLTGEGVEGSQAQLAEKLNMTTGAVKTAIHRLRKRFRDKLKAEIAETVNSKKEVEEEMQNLFNALTG